MTPQEFVVKMLIGRSKRTKSHSFVHMRDGDSLKQLFVCNYYSNDAVCNLIKVKKKIQFKLDEFGCQTNNHLHQLVSEKGKMNMSHCLSLKREMIK